MASDGKERDDAAHAANAVNEPPPRYMSPDGVSQLQRIAAALRGRYEIRREVGRGGAAFVYLARDLRADRDVALKVLRAELAVDVGEARFRREIGIAGQLRHPNILPVLDVGPADGQLFFTMPYVEGETLRTRLKRERQLKLHDALAIAREVGRGLDHAHASGVVHRDIKPANILLDDSHAVVADFGIARAMKVAAGEEITDSGMAIGTPEYMSPEQGTGERELDARSDVYALGCVVYEMLAGEPPFTGPSGQAIIARHCHEPPRSIRVIRPAVPLGVERAIERALAKVPADRFETAGQFVDALESGTKSSFDLFGLAHLRRRYQTLLAAGVVAVAASGAWAIAGPRGPALDRNRVVVFPLNDASTTPTGGGEGVATFIGYALDGARPLKWLDGWELLDPVRRTSGARVDAEGASRLSRRAGAAFYIDGSIVRRPDSVTVILHLHSVDGDSTLRTEGRSGPAGTASLPQLGLAAVQALLPDLVAPGGRIDLTALSERKPTAVANFLQGEREYRRMQFRAALPHYQAALRADSAFAIAALRGAYAASWLSELTGAAELAEAALRHRSALAPAQVHVARGLRAYLGGSADLAVVYLRRALASDSLVHGAWTLLGETYSRLLPSEWAADSLARAALERARAADPDFAPTLLLLEEMAVRDGDVRRAVRLSGELRNAGADTTHASARALMLRCVRDGPRTIDWPSAVARDHLSVFTAGKLLGAGAAQPACAGAAFLALLSSQEVPRNTRWAAYFGLQSQLAAIGRAGEWPAMQARLRMDDLSLRIPYLVAATAGGAFRAEARAVADSAARMYDKTSATTLWLLGNFEAAEHGVTRLRAISQALRTKADSSRLPRDVRLAQAIDARLHLLDGDTADALAALRSLKPSASRAEIGWWPWESLGPERMLTAKLLFARGRYAEARQTASYLDATEPMTYPFYLRESLDLRARAADAMNDKALADRYRQRLARLSTSRIGVP